MSILDPVEVICDYCGEKAQIVTGDRIYPHRGDLKAKKFYFCANGHDPAYVGTHEHTVKPLGRLADARLRQAKSRAHAAFDPIWKKKHMNRSNAYYWLAGKMDLLPADCHIGMFNVEQCKQVEAVMRKFWMNEGAKR